jgi:hypothetical protein
MPLATLLSALIHSLPFVLAKWQLAVVGWILYMFAALIVGDDTEYV